MYRHNGKRIRSKAEVERINALAIPPAWSDVAIARSPRAKVLAKGIDGAGREQAIYNPAYRRRQEQAKYARMEEFAEVLPRLRRRVDRDLRRRGLPQDRVIACVIRLMDVQYFRVGNSRYAKEHRSFGITTLQHDHVNATTAGVDFDFIGKSGKRHRVKARDRRAARVISQLLDVPGSDVFQFFDDGGKIRKVRSHHINEYLRRHSGGASFTAKDFRTWGGSLLTATGLFALDDDAWQTSQSREAALRDVIKEVAAQLGNTPAVTRSSYIAPQILTIVERRDDFEAVRKRRKKMRDHKFFSVDEQCVVEILSLGSA